jgi:hypothetical protein
MDTKRQIKGTTYSIPELVQNAITSADSQPLNLESARKSLAFLGNTNPSDEQVTRYARETVILDILARATGAFGFENQIGKINFSSTDNAIADVNAYLGRRNTAAHARWTTNHR